MSGPIEPWRSRSLTKGAAERQASVAWNRFWDAIEGKEPRETRPRDRSLNGKARIAARRAARRTS